MDKFTRILLVIVFFGLFVAVHISRTNSKDGKGDNASAAIEPHDLQAIRVAPQANQRTHACPPDSVRLKAGRELNPRPSGSCTDRHQVRFCGGPDVPILLGLVRCHQFSVMPEEKLFIRWWTLICNLGLCRKKC
jgi:hypothetical protein